MFFFFFNDTATTEIYTLSLHDALPIFLPTVRLLGLDAAYWVRPSSERAHLRWVRPEPEERLLEDRKSTRLNSSHANISYAVFCLKKNKNDKTEPVTLDVQLVEPFREVL